MDKKTTFQWNTLFQAFWTKEFQVLLQDDPSAKLSKGIYQNISNYGLYRATPKPLVLPCLDIIEWLTQKLIHESRTLVDFEGKHVESYQSYVLNQIYHFKESKIKVTKEWI